jgi:hypothetical protein
MRWLLEGATDRPAVPHGRARHHATYPWWKVMCLTGVDYFSTLGYQPGIAALAAGALSPFATLVLVLVTLGGALPVYRRVAAESPHGEGSIAMLEHRLPWWQGKLFVLVLLGFMMTDFIITITLSAADATAHISENPFLKPYLDGQQVPITLALIAVLGAIFLKGFKEAIGIAVALVGVYLALNAVVVGVSLYEAAVHPDWIINWRGLLFTTYGNPLAMLGLSLLLFPKLALGLSGFETGVAVMPLVRGAPGDTEENPAGRVRNTRRLLLAAALIMSIFLLGSSLTTIVLIPSDAFQEGGEANGRALAYLAHEYLGEIFGTIYDLSTITILWFAGASAMAGLLNIVPRYLPRYGMAPSWTRATRPLVLLFTTIAFLVTIIFRASVDAQGGAYATGVLVLITSAAAAVTISAYQRRGSRAGRRWLVFAGITAVFIYTTVVNIIERPDGLKIALCFIAGIITTSLVSRVWRSTELRVERIQFDATAQRFIEEASRGTIRLIANQRQMGDLREYNLKERQTREDNHIPPDDPVLFLEVHVADASEFTDVLEVTGVTVGNHRVLRVESSAVPNAIAALLLYLRDTTGKQPHIYFTWSEHNPFVAIARFLLFGEGDVPPMTHEILRRAEPDPTRRPFLHVS